MPRRDSSVLDPLRPELPQSLDQCLKGLYLGEEKLRRRFGGHQGVAVKVSLNVSGECLTLLDDFLSDRLIPNNVLKASKADALVEAHHDFIEQFKDDEGFVRGAKCSKTFP